MDTKNLISTAKSLNTLFRVIQKAASIAAIVVLCVLAALTIANAINSSTVIGEGLNKLSIGPITIALTPEHTPSNWNILGYSWICGIVAAASLLVLCKGLHYLQKILAPMESSNPFHPDTATYIKKLAIVSLILGIIQNVGSWAETYGALYFFGLNQLSSAEMIQSVTANFSLEPSFLILFFLLLLMSYIFTYGAQLQQLSDETL